MNPLVYWDIFTYYGLLGDTKEGLDALFFNNHIQLEENQYLGYHAAVHRMLCFVALHAINSAFACPIRISSFPRYPPAPDTAPNTPIHHHLRHLRGTL